MVDKKAQGKKNREKGAAFELKVRKDLEKKGWIVDKWSNNVEFTKTNSVETYGMVYENKFIYGKLIPAKRKFNPFKKVMSIGTGFPDYLCFQEVPVNLAPQDYKKVYEVIGVEAKSNGYLDPKERMRCHWLLNSRIFSKILIAKKGEKRGQIIYEDFNQKKGGVK